MISGITGFGQGIDFMVMNSSYEADIMIKNIENLAADGYAFSFDEVLAYYNKKASDFMPNDIHRMQRKVEEVNAPYNNMDRR